jgi:hypothetical protein
MKLVGAGGQHRTALADGWMGVSERKLQALQSQLIRVPTTIEALAGWFGCVGVYD